MAEMRIAVGSDERTELTDAVIAELVQRGMELELHGALTPGDDPNWPVVASAVASRVASGDVPQGILFCWTGTGVSMAANKVAGARAPFAPTPPPRTAPAAGTTPIFSP